MTRMLPPTIHSTTQSTAERRLFQIIRDAALMHTSPAIVSRLESGHDVRVSTLEKYVAALGLRLELNALPPKKPMTKASRPRRTKK